MTRRALTLRVAAPAAALALHSLAAAAPRLTEELYARRAYPAIAGLLGRASGAVGFSVAEPLCAVAAIAACVLGAQRVRRVRRREQAVSAALADLAGVLGAGWLLFLACWGLNYQRLPLAASAGLDVRAAASGELAALCAQLADEANRLREGLPEDARGVLRLRDGRAAALRRVGLGYRELARRYAFLKLASFRPKPLWSSTLFSYLGITGIYFPFSAEANVNTTLPDVELPVSAAHELAHRLGFAREDEASFLGYLACRLHPDADLRYAGVLHASRHAVAALAAADRKAYEAIVARRTDAVRRDLEASAAWSRRYHGRAAEVSSAVNDAYLRSQGERRGVASYGRMVDLLLAERRSGAACTTDAHRP